MNIRNNNLKESEVIFIDLLAHAVFELLLCFTFQFLHFSFSHTFPKKNVVIKLL